MFSPSLADPGLAAAAMHPFASYVLRSYYKQTGWNEDNLYANLTRSSNGEHICFLFAQNIVRTLEQHFSTSACPEGCTSPSPSRPIRSSRRRTR